METLHKVIINGNEVESLTTFLHEVTNEAHAASVLEKRICKKIAAEKKATEIINGIEYEFRFETRGGKREGSGRPTKDYKRVNFCASAETLQILEGVEKKSEFINNAISVYNQIFGNYDVRMDEKVQRLKELIKQEPAATFQIKSNALLEALAAKQK